MTPEDHAKLLKVAGLLASDNAGERANAAARATEILERNGMSWTDALASVPVETLFVSDTISVEPVFDDEVTRLRSALATSEAMWRSLAEELDTVKPPESSIL
ncbi:hypothetical protein ASG43_11765 [Aureimonas sp. Leaf454]|uniref:hypothetical protein n=1 Tax=Aureimonas sp. Leaf454 TaxID=1736381 RepID=UPI0006FDF731|nr:hypothetical protein [Aureimonas sp. Leaf454]KQT46298.1 hypothetical protein ASG43_11765 [Aureimonas sp. Leaf454]